MNRPDIRDIKSGDELKKWYWLKQELIDYCKLTQLSYTGAKFDILDRIASSLDNESSKPINLKPRPKPTSKFLWSTSKLTLNTIITDSYTNGPNTREFFKKHCGDKFHFSIPFMDFMKKNYGKTLQDAVNEWIRLHEQTKSKGFKSNIPEGNQYNKYIRDFFADNPTKTIKDARHFWKLKRSLPLGRHIYESTDIKLK
jgi:Domain of unknown function (DUF6434)/SAP domain-containing new25